MANLILKSKKSACITTILFSIALITVWVSLFYSVDPVLKKGGGYLLWIITPHLIYGAFVFILYSKALNQWPQEIFLEMSTLFFVLRIIIPCIMVGTSVYVYLVSNDYQEGESTVIAARLLMLQVLIFGAMSLKEVSI